MLSKQKALEVINDLEDFALMADISPIGQVKALQEYVDNVEQMKQNITKFVQSIVDRNMSRGKPDIVFTNEINEHFKHLIEVWAEEIKV